MVAPSSLPLLICVSGLQLKKVNCKFRDGVYVGVLLWRMSHFLNTLPTVSAIAGMDAGKESSGTDAAYERFASVANI